MIFSCFFNYILSIIYENQAKSLEMIIIIFYIIVKFLISLYPKLKLANYS